MFVGFFGLKEMCVFVGEGNVFINLIFVVDMDMM